jgi:hypothetical protein
VLVYEPVPSSQYHARCHKMKVYIGMFTAMEVAMLAVVVSTLLYTLFSSTANVCSNSSTL